MTDQEILNANQEAIAAAVNSIAFANALAIVSVGAILDAKQVISKERFADMMTKLAGIVETMPQPAGDAGGQMLRKVYEIINAPESAKWTPSIVPGGRG